jgi:hypothetical protein
MLLLLRNWKLVLCIGSIGLLLTLLSLGYIRRIGLESERDALVHQVSTLEGNLLVERSHKDRALQAIGEWKEAAARQQATAEELRRVNRDATAEIRRLTKVFGEHDLRKLAQAKPKLVEDRVNTGTDAARRLLNCTTGGSTCP